MLDPVPGNLISPSTLDPFKTTLANKTMDLRSCRPLKRVLALYPYEPLDDLAFHAPLFASYPPHVNVKEEVLPGCHAEAETVSTNAGRINEFRIKEFFAKNGTVFVGCEKFINEDEDLKKNLLKFYQWAFETTKFRGPITRDGHSAKGLKIEVTPEGEYFNEDHRRRAGGEVEAKVAAEINLSNHFFAIIKRKIADNPIAWQIFKWTLIGLAISSLLFVSGGFGVVPVFSVLLAKVGIAGLFIAAPFISAAAAAFWYGIVKPLALWTVNKLFYPWYSIRDIKPEPNEIVRDSPTKLNNWLDVSIEKKSSQKAELKKPYHGDKLLSANDRIPEIFSEPGQNFSI
ncbi:MAG: hypothetical protein H0U57_07000 [Tatlockia sp.]|nr:hypothetical protein [Tatlockia sp.]